jgi:parvulin-like peptidyl-prolyl isomerase
MLTRLYKEALDRLIRRTLILAEFDVLKADDKIDLPDEAVNKRIDGIILDRYHNNRALFFEDLKQSGMTFSEFKEQTRNNLVMLVMRNRGLIGNIQVSPAAAKALYLENLDDYKIPARCELGMIVFHGDGVDDKRMRDARITLAELRDGADFAALARERSDGGKAKDGGYKGWLKTNDLREELRDAVKEMKEDEVSGIIKAGDILYILKLYKKQDETVKRFKDVQEQLKRVLMREEHERLMNEWEERLRAKHHITRYPIPPQF